MKDVLYEVVVAAPGQVVGHHHHGRAGGREQVLDWVVLVGLDWVESGQLPCQASWQSGQSGAVLDRLPAVLDTNPLGRE